jgi:DNA-directed RNA polymerase specialized sigma24 family protein
MDEHDWLAERFEANRAHPRAVAYRMRGSLSEADDAAQEAWLRLSRSAMSGVDNQAWPPGYVKPATSRAVTSMPRRASSE